MSRFGAKVREEASCGRCRSRDPGIRALSPSTPTRPVRASPQRSHYATGPTPQARRRRQPGTGVWLCPRPSKPKRRATTFRGSPGPSKRRAPRPQTVPSARDGTTPRRNWQQQREVTTSTRGGCSCRGREGATATGFVIACMGSPSSLRAWFPPGPDVGGSGGDIPGGELEGSSSAAERVGGCTPWYGSVGRHGLTIHINMLTNQVSLCSQVLRGDDLRLQPAGNPRVPRVCRWHRNAGREDSLGRAHGVE